MYKRRTAKQIKLDEQRGAGKLEYEEATKEAKEAFRHKPYQSIHTSEGGKRHRIGDGSSGQGRYQKRELQEERIFTRISKAQKKN